MQCYSNPTYCSDDFTYIRKTTEIPILTQAVRGLHFIVSEIEEEVTHQIIRHIIGFCGNWYFIYSVKTRNNYYNLEHQHLNYTFYVNIKSALKSNFNIRNIKKQYKSNNFKYGSLFKKHRLSTFEKTLNKVLQIHTEYEQRELAKMTIILNKLNLFELHNTPVIEIKTHTNYKYRNIILNPNLQKLSFYKHIEGNIAYQEIEMFLGNELLPKDNPDQITDNNILIANHGFGKTSFRKAPSKNDKRIKRKYNKLRKQNK